QFLDSLRYFVASLRRIAFVAEAKIGKIRGRNLRRDEIFAFCLAEGGVSFAEGGEDFVVEPGFVAKFKGGANLFWHSGKEILEYRQVELKLRGQLEENRSQFLRSLHWL